MVNAVLLLQWLPFEQRISAPQLRIATQVIAITRSAAYASQLASASYDAPASGPRFFRVCLPPHDHTPHCAVPCHNHTDFCMIVQLEERLADLTAFLHIARCVRQHDLVSMCMFMRAYSFYRSTLMPVIMQRRLPVKMSTRTS